MSLTARISALLVGIGVLLLAVLLMQLALIPAVLLDPSIAIDPEEASRMVVMIAMPLGFLGMGAAGALYLRLTNRSWEWLDITRPDRWDVVWMVGGTIIAFAGLITVGVIGQVLGIQPPEQGIVVMIRDDVALIVYMIAIIWLLNAPAEELIFRNIIQKRLYAAYSGITAVVIASVLFAVIHIFTFVTAGTEWIGVLLPTTAIFLGSLVMGYAYLRTRNLLVPIVIHAGFNSIQMVLLLLMQLFDVGPETASLLSLLVVF